MGLNIFSLDGKVGLVTGAGRGLGKEMALGLAEAGADVVLADINLSDVESVKNQVEKIGKRGLALQVNVSERKDVDRMVDSCINAFEKVDILINNAGVVARNDILNVGEEDFDHVVNVNLKGALFCAQRVAKEMIKRSGGKIINIASMGGVVALPGTGVYRASKAALIHLTKTMALEWVQYGINVNAIGPGYFNTPMTRYIRDTKKEEYDYISRSIPMKRWGDPRELVGVAVFLSSPASSYLTGQTIFVDGGILIKQ